MILAGTGIIDSQKGSALPAEFVIVGNSSTMANRIQTTPVNNPQPWPTTTWSASAGALGTGVFNLYDVIYNGTIWVAVGAKSLNPQNGIVYSLNGTSWNFADVVTGANAFTNIKWNGSKFLAVKQNSSQYFSSLDGINWIEELGLNSLLVGVYSLSWFNNYWYAGGFDGGTLGRIYRSTDGVSWSAVYNSSPNQNPVYGLGNNGTILVGLEGIFPLMIWSNNGTTWTKGTLPSNLGFPNGVFNVPLIWCGSPINKFVMGGLSGVQTANKMISSSDGKTWSAVNTSTIFGSSGTVNTNRYVSDLVWDGTYLWITAANANSTWPGVLFKTTDLVNFTRILTSSLTGNSLFGIAKKS